MGGHLTDKIILEQGVPQGDVISSYSRSFTYKNQPHCQHGRDKLC